MENQLVPVLIVDDDPTTAAVLRGMVRGLGGGIKYEPTCVGTGADARRQLQDADWQLVLLDYLLPDEDGLSLLAAVNGLAEHRRPVVVMLTGGGNEQVAVEAMKLGAKDYLVKTSLNHATLRRAITSALERRRLESQLAESTALLHRQHEQIEADLQMAREVQQALLPQAYPVFPPGAAPERSRLAFSHRWQPSHQVAGDFFAVFPVSDSAAGVFQCDVMGHGVRAALITTMLRGLVREQQAQAADPGAFLATLNRQFQMTMARAGDLVFVTAVYVVVDVATGELRLANAGHPEPLHLRRAAGTVAPCHDPDGPGPALGLVEDFTYSALRRPFAPGDGVLMFTDGVYEAANRRGEDFGRQRLQSSVLARLAQPSAQMLDGLLEDVAAFRQAGTEPLPDDVCLVAVDRPAAG